MPVEKRVNVPKVAGARHPQHKPKLGQHFLASEDGAQRIVDALGDMSQSTVLEIGPGPGVTTDLLRERVARLTCVEIDRGLAGAVTVVCFSSLYRSYQIRWRVLRNR